MIQSAHQGIPLVVWRRGTAVESESANWFRGATKGRAQPFFSPVERFQIPTSQRLDRVVVLDDSFGNGVPGEAGDIMNVQFVHDLLPVFFHGFDADF